MSVSNTIFRTKTKNINSKTKKNINTININLVWGEKADLVKCNKDGQLPSSCLLSGGGSCLKLAQNIYKVKIILPLQTSCKRNKCEYLSSAFLTCLGKTIARRLYLCCMFTVLICCYRKMLLYSQDALASYTNFSKKTRQRSRVLRSVGRGKSRVELSTRNLLTLISQSDSPPAAAGASSLQVSGPSPHHSTGKNQP